MSPKRAKDSLDRYREKRDFSVTPEPAGKSRGHSEAERIFVVQRHRARRLHYDFRLEVDGVLASWAMPRGPSLDPSVRSLAVHVEDHPIEYRDFEGVIPGGQYGAGDVIVWDRGTWAPAGDEDPKAAIAGGELHFDLHGEKLRGRFVLVRTRQDRAGREQWLMLHKRDEYAQSGWKPEEHRQSVKSGRTNEEVAASPEAMWHGDLPPDRAEERVDGKAAKEGSHRSSTPRRSSGPEAPSPKRATRSSKSTPAPASKSTPAPASKKNKVEKKAGRKTSKQGGGGRDLSSLAPSDPELEALDALGDKGTWELQGRHLELTNLNKVLFPASESEEPLTKRDLIRYYAQIAPAIVPYLVERPLNMHRYPNGVNRPGFWHKEIPEYAPDWITRWRNTAADPGETEWYAVADNLPAMVWMANYAAIELHPWTSTIRDVQEPTWAYIDIDPGTKTSFDEVVLLARLFRGGLDHLGVFALPKLTGRRGIHIWIPIQPGYSFDDTRAWVEKLSRAVGEAVPDLVSWSWQKNARRGLARLDYTQNAINKTLVAPYSVRAAPGGPVSVPITWEELDDPNLRSDQFTIRSLGERLNEAGDPFAQILGYSQRLPQM
jgi:bifunctional non-homologous end joining protein LigD